MSENNEARIQALDLKRISTISPAGQFVISANGEYFGAYFDRKSKGGVKVRKQPHALPVKLFSEFGVEALGIINVAAVKAAMQEAPKTEVEALAAWCKRTGYSVGSDLYGKAVAVSRDNGKGVRAWRMATIEGLKIALDEREFFLRGGAIALAQSTGSLIPTLTLGDKALPLYPAGLVVARA